VGLAIKTFPLSTHTGEGPLYCRGVTGGHLYDYRLTIEQRGGGTRTVTLLSSDKLQEAQVVTVEGERCIVSTVSPGPELRPGEPQIVFVHCFTVR
jgi:hypothetical protein